MTSPDHCPACGTPRSCAVAGGLCPGCLLGAVLERGGMPDEEAGLTGGMACGPYVLERELGRGGTGVVYLARQPGLDRPLALKMPAALHFSGPDEVRRFRLEVESVARLEHPHIVPVHAAGEHEGRPYFVMKFAAGGNLAERLEGRPAGGPTPDGIRTEVALLAKVARAVQFAHERGVLHRDLKPANVLLDERGEPMVGDFGLARVLDDAARATLTGAALGTPAYMSPEQALGQPVTTATDIYGLGAVLFHQLAGRPPFVAAGPLEVLRQVGGGDAPELRSVAPGIDRDLATVCGKCLRRDPAKRYRSAAALADDLDRWLRGEAVDARPIGWAERGWRWARRRPVVATLGGVSLLGGLGFVATLIAGAVLLREERNEARRQESLARAMAIEARVAGEARRLHAYAADVYLASRALGDGHLGVARRMLDRQRPAAGEEDPRGFEWFAFQEQCRGDEARVWLDHGAAVTAVAIDPAGGRLASGGRDGLLVVRSLADGAELLRLPAADAPRGAAEIPRMTALAAGSPELAALLLRGGLNFDEMRMRGRPSKLGEILGLAWSPDGRRLVSTGEGAYVRIWSMPEGGLAGLIPLTQVRTAFFSGDGRHLVLVRHDGSGRREHEVAVFRGDDLLRVRSIRGVEPCAALSPDGQSLAVMPRGGTRIEVQGLLDGRLEASWEAGMAVGGLEFSRDGALLIGRRFDGLEVVAWRVADGRREGVVAGGVPVVVLAAGPGEEWLATAGAGQVIELKRLPSLERGRLLRGHEDGIHALDFSPDGRWLASGGNDHQTRVWELSAKGGTAGPPSRSPLPDAFTAAVPEGLWSGDGKRGGRVALRDRSGKELRRAPGPPGAYVRLVAAPDGSRLGVLHWPRDLSVWDGSGGWKPSWRLSGGTVGPVVFSPDGKWLASGGDDNLVTVRDAADGVVRATLRGHLGGILSLAFSPDGRTLASSAADGTLRLWHLPTWRELGILHAGGNLKALEFAEEGRALIATDEEGGAKRFPAPREDGK
jgi:WD40 repeat protein